MAEFQEQVAASGWGCASNDREQAGEAEGVWAQGWSLILGLHPFAPRSSTTRLRWSSSWQSMAMSTSL